MEQLTRSRFLSLGAAMGAGAALAACGANPGTDSGSAGSSGSSDTSGGQTSDGGSSSGGETSSAPETTARDSGSAPSGGASIAAESDVAVGDSVTFEDDGQPAVLVHLDNGDFVAYSAVCTHQGCEVAYRGAELVCPCHGSVFDPSNGGSVVNGPATAPLAEIPVEVQGGEVVRA